MKLLDSIFCAFYRFEKFYIKRKYLIWLYKCVDKIGLCKYGGKLYTGTVWSQPRHGIGQSFITTIFKKYKEEFNSSDTRIL